MIAIVVKKAAKPARATISILRDGSGAKGGWPGTTRRKLFNEAPPISVALLYFCCASRYSWFAWFASLIKLSPAALLEVEDVALAFNDWILPWSVFINEAVL